MTAADGSSDFGGKRALVDGVFESIASLIIDGHLRAGERANIEHLARALRVSATPVREALARLEAEGLVTKENLKGYKVAQPLDARGFDKLFQLRALLEPEAAKLAANRIGAYELVGLRAGVDYMKSATAEGPISNQHFEDFKSFVEEDANLHRIIAESSGNELLADAIGRLRPHMHQYRLRFERAIAEETNDEHEAIVVALEIADSAAAEQAMRTHLAKSRLRVAQQFARLTPRTAQLRG